MFCIFLPISNKKILGWLTYSLTYITSRAPCDKIPTVANFFGGFTYIQNLLFMRQLVSHQVPQFPGVIDKANIEVLVFL